MPGWVGNIEQETIANETFRTVVFTGGHTQLTVMSIEPGDDIGGEVHHGHDQFLRIEAGKARVESWAAPRSPEEVHEVEDDWAVIVPSGVWHNVVNTGDEPLKVYSLYSPPEHPDGTVHRTRPTRSRPSTRRGGAAGAPLCLDGAPEGAVRLARRRRAPPLPGRRRGRRVRGLPGARACRRSCSGSAWPRSTAACTPLATRRSRSRS